MKKNEIKQVLSQIETERSFGYDSSITSSESLVSPRYTRILDKILHVCSRSWSLLIIHDADPDGYTAASYMEKAMIQKFLSVAYRPGFEWGCKSEAIGHGPSFKEFLSSKKIETYDGFNSVIILDHDIDAEAAKRLTEVFGDQWLAVDHHDGSKEVATMPAYQDQVFYFKDSPSLVSMHLYFDLSNFKERFSIDRSLAYIVDHYDNWRFGQPGMEKFDLICRAFCQYLYAKGPSTFNFAHFHDVKVLVKTIKKALTHYELKEKEIQKIADRAALAIFAPKPADKVFLSTIAFHGSDIDILAEKMLERSALAVVVYTKHNAENEKVVKVSLRSKGDVDVGKVAAQYGGGGRENTAGMEISWKTLAGFLSLFIKVPMPLNDKLGLATDIQGSSGENPPV